MYSWGRRIPVSYTHLEGTVELALEDSYYNMKDQIASHMEIVERAEKAMLAVGVTPKIQPIRGGTDGARLSFMGLPCPNLSTGAHNGHGRFEYVCIQSMDRMVEVLLEILRSVSYTHLDVYKRQL